MKFFITILFLFLLSWAKAQNISSLNTGNIVELECLESRTTGTVVCASMERNLGKTRVLLHRSTNQGSSWTLVDSVVPPVGNVEQTEIPDPVLTQDAAGNFYMTCMRVFKTVNVSETTVDLEFYKSVDDGLSWQYVSHPHQNDSIADYPQITSDNNGNLHLVYSYISGFPTPVHSRLYCKKSTDTGNSWSSPQVVGQDSLFNIGADITYGKDSMLFITSGNRDTNRIDVFKSVDQGTTWSKENEFFLDVQEFNHITKPIMHRDYSTYGILSHRAHQLHAPIYYHGFTNGNSFSQVIDSGAYAQGIILDNGVIHIIYNQKDQQQFLMYYIYSTDGGQTFTSPVVLLSGFYDEFGAGEYQAFFQGNDGQLYVAFSDWSDGGKAKMLVFPPEFNALYEDEKISVNIYPNPARESIQVEWHDVVLDKIKVRDCTGKVVFSESLYTGESTTINVSEFPAGIYFVELHWGSQVVIRQLVVK